MASQGGRSDATTSHQQPATPTQPEAQRSGQRTASADTNRVPVDESSTRSDGRGFEGGARHMNGPSPSTPTPNHQSQIFDQGRANAQAQAYAQAQAHFQDDGYYQAQAFAQGQQYGTGPAIQGYDTFEGYANLGAYHPLPYYQMLPYHNQDIVGMDIIHASPAYGVESQNQHSVTSSTDQRGTIHFHYPTPTPARAAAPQQHAQYGRAAPPGSRWELRFIPRESWPEHAPRFAQILSGVAQTHEQLSENLAALLMPAFENMEPRQHVEVLEAQKRIVKEHIDRLVERKKSLEKQLEEERSGRGRNSYEVVVGLEKEVEEATGRLDFLSTKWVDLGGAIQAVHGDLATTSAS